MFGLRSISTSKTYLAALLGDSFWTNTTLLLNGENAGTGTFLDSSANASTGTASGTPYQGNFSPFDLQGGSGFFNGSTDYISYPAVSGAYNAAGDFTIEAWVYYTGTNAVEAAIAGQWQQGVTANSSWLMDISTAGRLVFGAYIGSTFSSLTGTTRVVPRNRWCHVAVVRSSNVVRLYVDGVVDATTLSLSGTLNNSAAAVTVGRVVGGSTLSMIGYVSNLRFVKDTAVYTAAFTPPTAPLSAVTGTALLTKFENALVSDQTRNINVKSSGNTSITTSITKYGTRSIDFDGTGDFLTVTGSSELLFGNGALTVEGWFYFRSLVGGPIIWRLVGTSTLSLYYDTTNNRLVLDFGTPLITTSTSLTTGTWYHIAVVRTDGAGSVTIYLNGTSIGTTAVSAVVDFSATTQVTVGALETDGTRGVNGVIDDFRISQRSRYTGTFSPPAEAFYAPTLDTYKYLFLDGAGAVVADSSSNAHTITNTGVTLASDAGSRGSASGNALVFNGSAYIKTAATNKFYIVSNADWTLEAWIKPSANDKIIFSSGAPGSASWLGAGYCLVCAFYAVGGNVMGAEFKRGNGITTITKGTTAVTINAWTHVAYVHDGLSKTMTIFVNGKADVSFSTAAWVGSTFTPELAIGSFSGPTPTSGNFTGSMDNVTYWPGLVRYKTNFTPA